MYNKLVRSSRYLIYDDSKDNVTTSVPSNPSNRVPGYNVLVSNPLGYHSYVLYVEIFSNTSIRGRKKVSNSMTLFPTFADG